MGLSLILMTRAGLPVPPGFILPVSFFDAWISTLRDISEWAAMQKGNPGNIKQVTEDLKELSLQLTLNQEQQQVLINAIRQLQKTASTILFAVRSSSPDEDLEGASFAGGYKTILGVPTTGIEEALRRTFASCLDERVFLYKRKHGFPTDEPRIAVIVQNLVTAESAGVAFSLNPANN